MKVRGMTNGVWDTPDPERTPDGKPRPPVYKLVNGSAHIRCGSCGEWTRAHDAPTGVVGHWGWRPNPFFMKFNPKLGGIDDREKLRVVKMRRAELCEACGYLWSGVRASAPTIQAVWIPDPIERGR